jgi:hypothetical protein
MSEIDSTQCLSPSPPTPGGTPACAKSPLRVLGSAGAVTERVRARPLALGDAHDDLSLDPNGQRAGAGDSTWDEVGTTSGADVVSPARLGGNIFSC